MSPYIVIYLSYYLSLAGEIIKMTLKYSVFPEDNNLFAPKLLPYKEIFQGPETRLLDLRKTSKWF